jgi:hypothetical protein
MGLKVLGSKFGVKNSDLELMIKVPFQLVKSKLNIL